MYFLTKIVTFVIDHYQYRGVFLKLFYPDVLIQYLAVPLGVKVGLMSKYIRNYRHASANGQWSPDIPQKVNYCTTFTVLELTNGKFNIFSLKRKQGAYRAKKLKTSD